MQILAVAGAGVIVLVACLMFFSAGKQITKWEHQAQPAEVIRRAVALQKREAEERIAETGEATRLAIQEAMKRHQR